MYSSTRTQRVENRNYYRLTLLQNVHAQDAIPVYSVLKGSERKLVEQPEYANINKPKKQMVSPKGPPCQTENLIASPKQESQGDLLRYAQPDLSKKKRPHRSVLSTSNESPPPIPPRTEDEDYI